MSSLVTSSKICILGQKLTKCVVQRMKGKEKERFGDADTGGDRVCLFCEESP
jgi:hypothetical protein